LGLCFQMSQKLHLAMHTLVRANSARRMEPLRNVLSMCLCFEFIESSLTGISVFTSLPAFNIHPIPSGGAVLFMPSIPNDSGDPRRGQSFLIRIEENQELPRFQAISRTPLSLLLPAPGFLSPPPPPIRSARASRRSAAHACKQPPGQMTLRQHQPVVPRVLKSAHERREFGSKCGESTCLRTSSGRRDATNEVRGAILNGSLPNCPAR